MDYITKWPEAYAHPNQEASTVAEALVTNFFCRFCIPWELHSDQCRNFESRLLHTIHIHKLSILKIYREKFGSGLGNASKNLSLISQSKFLQTTRNKFLGWGLNFTIENPHFYLDISCAVESVITKLPPILGR
jgi:hypothetical protein